MIPRHEGKVFPFSALKQDTASSMKPVTGSNGLVRFWISRSRRHP